MTKFLKTQWLRIVVHVGVWLPLLWIIADGFLGQLGPEPIREIILRTGKTALILLILCLACTPLNTLLRFRSALRVRRALGLYAFMYASFHLLTFVGVDYGFDVELLREAIFEKPYALVGLAGFLILLPLALTSTKDWMKRLGQNWRKLHYGIYFAALLVIVHFVWLVKLDVREPLTYGAIVVALLLMRVPRIRSTLVRLTTLSLGRSSDSANKTVGHIES
ncbi:MAG: sulfoxide reductase heme-binding subunit YedZ [Chloroflexi bacterium]|nr:sulfoxide reductase heme-binding subunit YedZ [Chloroflexota bacterium]